MHYCSSKSRDKETTKVTVAETRQTQQHKATSTNVLTDGGSMAQPRQNKDPVYSVEVYSWSKSRATGKLQVTVQANQVNLQMEIDIGAANSVIGEITYRNT